MAEPTPYPIMGSSLRLRRFWLWWTLANALGGAVVGALEEAGWQFLATLVLTGLVVGVAQFLMLRRQIRYAIGWIPVSALGWVLSVLLVTSLDPVLDAIAYGLLTILGLWEVFWINVVKQPVLLAVWGLAQWLILRLHRPNLQAWIGISALGGAVQGGMSAIICAVGCAAIAQTLGAIVATAVTYAVGWAGYGIVTGLWLERRLQQPPVS